MAEKSSYRRQNKILADQSKQISSYGVDPTTGNITIPVEKAMELIAADNPTPKKMSAAGKKPAAQADHGHDETKHENKHSDEEHSDKKHDVDHKKESDTDAV